MAELFCRSLAEYRKAGKFLLHFFVVMPDHIHLLITVPQGATLERTMQFIKGGFSREAGKVIRLTHPFWQKSFFDRRVRDWAEFEKYRDYIHHNPVAAGLCDSSAQYPYSSINQSLALDEPPQRLKPQSLAVAEMYR